MAMTSASDTTPDDHAHNEHPVALRAERATRATVDDSVQRRDALVETHLGLARGIARRYTGRGIDDEDLFGVACLALVLAATRFDPQRGTTFAGYAAITIHGELKRHLRDYGWAVRPPRSLHDTYHAVLHATGDLTQVLGAAPTVADIAEDLDISADQVREAQHVGSAYTAASLEALAEERPGGFLHEPFMTSVDPFGAVDLALTVDQVVSCLSSRDREIVRLRFEQELSQHR